MLPHGRKRQKSDQKAMKEIIHSGHFMVSDIDDSEVQDGDDSPSLVVHESDCDQESLPLPDRGFDFESACKETSKTYTFGSRSSHSISIDASLTKLFECMTLAYSGKLTSPRWKQFKGLKLRLKEKIRLNNMIWRAWHMQFVMKIKTDKLCQFATPLDGDTHMKPEAVVIEGTYWKRRMANITAEYQKWRLFYRDRCRIKPSPEAESMAMDLDTRWPSWAKDTYSSLQSAMDEDFIMDFSDTLFSSFNPSQPFDFPNPREIAAKAGIADFIQPGLVQLQPSVDDFMDTLEPIADLFSDYLNARLPPLPEETTFNSSLQDMLPSTSDQDLFSLPKPHFGRSSLSNAFSHSSSSSSPGKRNNFRKPLPSRSFHHQSPSPSFSSNKTMLESLNARSSNSPLMNTPSFSGNKTMLETLNARSSNSPLMNTPSFSNNKTMLETLNARSSNSPLLNENVPLLTPEQPLPSQPNPTQSFLCNNVMNQSAETPTIVSLLQGNMQNDVNNIQPTQESLASSLNMTSGHQAKHDHSNQFFSQQTYVSKPFDETNYSQQHMVQPNSSVQVPLQTLPQGQIASNAIPSATTNEGKNAKHPLFFSVSLGQLNQTFNSPGNFKVPAQVASANIFQPSTGQQATVVTSADVPVFRRHSYTTGQHLQPAQQGSGDYMGSRRSRPIAPAATNGNFVVPEIPQTRHRTRSRSVSTPQSSSPKPIMQQPVQALSLTDISSPLQTSVSNQDSLSKRTATADIIGQPVNVTNSSILPQNAVLAQLLSSGCNQQDANQTMLKVTTAATASVSSPVTIIRPILSTTAHTFVFSSLPISTTSGVTDFQRNILMGAANQVFGSQNSPPACVLPAPDSPGSSTCSSSPAISTVSFDSNQASKTVRLKSSEEKIQYREHRRVCHINAEQKRRCNIKNGFESLHNLLPPVGQTPNSKVSKAAMLQRGADYIRVLKSERHQQLEEAEMLKKQIDELNEAIGVFQSQLPASGAPVPCQRTNRMKEMFQEYVRQKTLENWKFWIFSLIIEPLVESYNNNVSGNSNEELAKTLMAWADQHCSLVALRPGVLNSLRHLSTSTNILSDPSCMPEEATRAVTKKENRQ